MIRVGIQTIIDCNFGNRLQNFALQETLKDIGCEVETVNDVSETCFVQSIKNMIKNLFNIGGYRSLRNAKSKLYSRDRMLVMQKWNEENIKFSKKKISRYHIPKNFKNEYDYFITGSDQVWNPYFRKDSLMLLSYAQRHQRISYAASLGVDAIPSKQLERYESELTKFSAISVREKNAIKIIEDIVGRKVEWVVDPTMLFTAEKWKRLEKKPEWLTSQNYIAVYSLGGLPEDVRTFIEKAALDKNWEIYEILKKDDPKLYLSTPFEFIYIIGHAKLLVTNSFHGTVFSILYKIPFINFDRRDVHGTMGARFDTLYELFQMNDRKYRDNITLDDILNCDFSMSDTALKKARQSSIEFMRNAIDVCEL